MNSIAMQEWEDIEHISKLTGESPARALKLINTGISEKAAILMHKNFGLRMDQSLLSLKDSYLSDVLNQLLFHSLIDKKQAVQIMRYKGTLNGRNENYIGTNIRQLCTDGLLILSEL